MCSSVLTALAQETLTVSGTVIDETNNPLVGVSVSVKDKVSKGAMTDDKGQYKIHTEPYSTLIFSYVGFLSQEIKLTTKSLLNVKLIRADSSALTQVIVTAAGPQKKVTVVGAVTAIDVDNLRTPTANITNGLAGNVPGIVAMQSSGEPGNNQSEFWIRGISTFGGNQSALILVDGFERPFNEINIEDIQSFSILKDASATAIYGSRGANGVVLITTKKGKAGKVNIDGKAEYGYLTRTRTPEFVDGYTYAQLLNEALTTRNKEALYTPSELELFRNNLDPDLYPNVDWKDKMLKDGTNIYRAAINLSGGASIARYFVSASYVDEGGMYKSDQNLKDYKTNAHMNRWNYRVNYDLDISKSTTLALGVSGFLEKQNFPGLNTQNIWYSLIGQSPVSIPFKYSNGLIPAYGTGNRTNPWVLATQTGYREHWENKNESNITLNQRLDMVTRGLRATARLAYDALSINDINRVKWPEQYNVQSRRDRNGNLIMNRISTEQLMTQSSGSAGERVYQGEIEVSYGRNFGGKHQVDGLIKSFVREYRMTQNLGTDIKTGLPRRNTSLSGRASYGYDSKYLVEFNFGYTGSENFKSGHQFGFFPAVAVGWNVAEEKFIRDNFFWLDMFKLRYSIGEVGNDFSVGGVRFAYLSDIASGGSYNFGEPVSPNSWAGMYYTQVASDNLTWEIARKQNVGVDISILKNKFFLTVDYYQERRRNIYMERSYLPSMVGVSSKPWANVGEMDNRGIDGNFSVQHKIGKVDVTLRGNMTYYKNKVLERDEQTSPYSYLMQQGYRVDQTKGLIALGLFKDYEEIRTSPKQTYGEVMPGDIKYKDVNGDGLINDEDIVPVGSSWRPALQYGVGFSASWKGLDINVLFQGTGRSTYFLNGPTVYPFSEGKWGNILTEVVDGRWVESSLAGGKTGTENVNAKYPRLSFGGNSNNYRNSTYWLRNGAYLRFKTFEMGYSVPAKMASRLRLRNLRLYFLAQNLYVWDQVKVWDPEMASSNGTNYPLPKTFTLGSVFKF